MPGIIGRWEPTSRPKGQRAMAQSGSDQDITIIVPTYNERNNLPKLVDGVLGSDDRFRLIIVDDGSPDGTGDLADACAARYPGRIEVLHRDRKLGLGTAYVAGFRLALAGTSRLIGTMDADLSHPIDRLPALVAATDGADLAIGSRYVPGGGSEGWPFHRRLLSRFGGTYARFVLQVPINDLTGGFKMYRRATLASLDLDHVRADGYGFQIECTWRVIRNGGRVAEVPIVFTDRVAGKSKLSSRIVWEAAILVWRLRFAGRAGRTSAR